MSELTQQFDQIAVLREAALAYLQHIGRSELSDTDADEHARLVVATGEIESMSATLSREMAPLARAFSASREIAPSKETADSLYVLLAVVVEAAQSALRALVDRNEQAAQTVVAKRTAIFELSADLQRQQVARLAQDDPNRLAKHRAQLEMLDKLRRLYSVSEHMAISVLPRSVLLGTLLVAFRRGAESTHPNAGPVVKCRAPPRSCCCQMASQSRA